jgi:hypothetical protein
MEKRLYLSIGTCLALVLSNNTMITGENGSRGNDKETREEREGR